MTGQKNFNLFEAFLAAFPVDLNSVLLETGEGKTLTYVQLLAGSARIANHLTQLGLGPGDRVTVQIDKSPTALCLYVACLRAGFVYHPLNTAYQESELAYFVSDAQPRVVVCGSNSKHLFTSLVHSCGIEHLLTLDADGVGSLLSGAAFHSDTFTTVAREADDLAALLYSSGTTGRPKGIMLSHQNLLSNGQTLAELWGFSASDRLLHVLPIFHVHGLFVAIHCVLLSGASMRWLDKFDVHRVLEFMPECTVMMGVPTYYTRLLERESFDKRASANMRLFISGSAPLLPETFNAFRERTGHTILERYGMSETGMNTSNPLLGERRAGTVGLQLPGVELRIVGEHNSVLEPGETGDLQVRGSNVFQGYWRMPEKTREDFTADGYFNTGDKATITSDGYVSIVGRSKDMIICGGLNVYPKEIEQLLDELPNVYESAIIGVPHADFGEAVIAVVVPEQNSDVIPIQLIEYCRQRIANFKVPKQVFVVESLPRNAMGKVQKNVLRDRYANCCSV